MNITVQSSCPLTFACRDGGLVLRGAADVP